MKILSGTRDFYKVSGAPKRVTDYLRYSVPHKYRYYENGYWFFHKDYLENVQVLGADAGGPVISSRVDDYAILHLRQDAPMIIVEAVWRALAKLHHPDKGGDPEQFKRYSAAYARIKKAGGNG